MLKVYFLRAGHRDRSAESPTLIPLHLRKSTSPWTFCLLCQRLTLYYGLFAPMFTRGTYKLPLGRGYLHGSILGNIYWCWWKASDPSLWFVCLHCSADEGPHIETNHLYTREKPCRRYTTIWCWYRFYSHHNGGKSRGHPISRSLSENRHLQSKHLKWEYSQSTEIYYIVNIVRPLLAWNFVSIHCRIILASSIYSSHSIWKLKHRTRLQLGFLKTAYTHFSRWEINLLWK